MTVALGKLRLENPLMIASGTYGIGDKHPEHYGVAGAFVAKTVTLSPRHGNPPPRLVETASGIVNYVGLENPGVERYAEIVGSLKCPTIFIASVYAVTPAELLQLLERLEPLRIIAGYELNLSCPNVKHRSVLPSIDRSWVKSMVRAARRATRHWLSCKLPPYSSIDGAAVCEAEGADAMCVSNTYPAVAFTPRGERVHGGLAGPAIKPLMLYNVYHVAQRVRIPVIASGGVTCGRDVAECLAVGARAVQLGSINFIHPDAPRRILREWRKREKTS